jgi:hypothetical protein
MPRSTIVIIEPNQLAGKVTKTEIVSDIELQQLIEVNARAWFAAQNARRR